MTNGKFVGF